jgi:hypothetical protein
MPTLRIHRRPSLPLGASGPHAFVEPDDVRSALALGGNVVDLQVAPTLAVAEATARPVRCAMPGCGRPRADPIHELIE